MFKGGDIEEPVMLTPKRGWMEERCTLPRDARVATVVCCFII